MILEELKEFYTQKLNATIWLDQGDCIIFKSGSFLFGFCQREKADISGMLTFYFETPGEVDSMFELLKRPEVEPPRKNEKYKIYHFYTIDPEGRNLEFQYFDHPLPSSN